MIGQGRYACSSFRNNKNSELVGSPNETEVIVGNVKTQGLLDTGSTVSTISQAFYNAHFSDQPKYPVEDILRIECADGNDLPYDGYVELDLSIATKKGKTNNMILPSCLFLIVPDSKYNAQVPVLIGTNILSSYMDELQYTYGDQYLQNAPLFTSVFMALRCLTLQEKKLKQQNNRLAIIKSAETQKVTIEPNSEIILHGYLDKTLPYHPVCCLIQSTKGAVIPDDIDITPTIVPYEYGKTRTTNVHLTNISTRTVTIPPNAILCELHPVTIENIQRYEEEDKKDQDPTDICLDGVTICTEDLTTEEIEQGKDY